MVMMREAIFIMFLNIKFNITQYLDMVKEVIPNKKSRRVAGSCCKEAMWLIYFVHLPCIHGDIRFCRSQRFLILQRSEPLRLWQFPLSLNSVLRWQIP